MFFAWFYLTIVLRPQNLYEVSEILFLVESEIRHEIFHNIFPKRQPKPSFTIYQGIASRVKLHAAFAIIYYSDSTKCC